MHQRQADVARQAPVAGEVVVQNAQLVVQLQRLFQRFNRQVDASDAFEAPGQRQMDVDVQRIEIGRLLQGVDRLMVLLHQTKRLASQVVGSTMIAFRAIQLIERCESSSRQTHAMLRTNGFRIGNRHDQVEVALGLL